mmetsp:Transcript_19472/g.48800  ORF Transcript_19472/g.48800 Transcript_19472/m.48800 type:complete len:379 (+) Transcript_19472:2923-4059(+)
MPHLGPNLVADGVNQQKVGSLSLQDGARFLHQRLEQLHLPSLDHRIHCSVLLSVDDLSPAHVDHVFELAVLVVRQRRGYVRADCRQHLFVLVREPCVSFFVHGLHHCHYVVFFALLRQREHRHAEYALDVPPRVPVVDVPLRVEKLALTHVLQVHELLRRGRVAHHAVAEVAPELGDVLRGNRVHLLLLLVDHHDKRRLGAQQVVHVGHDAVEHVAPDFLLLEPFRGVGVHPQQGTHPEQASNHNPHGLAGILVVLHRGEPHLFRVECGHLDAQVFLREVLDGAAGKHAADVGERVAQGGGRHRGESKLHAQTRVDRVAHQNHDEVVQEPKTNERNGGGDENALQLGAGHGNGEILRELLGIKQGGRLLRLHTLGLPC